MFLMKWREIDDPEWVLALQANVLCPKMVRSFFESRLSRAEEEEEEEEEEVSLA